MWLKWFHLIVLRCVDMRRCIASDFVFGDAFRSMRCLYVVYVCFVCVCACIVLNGDVLYMFCLYVFGCWVLCSCCAVCVWVGLFLMCWRGDDL